MARKDIHKEPFDEGTLLKLEIFHKYLNEWLPVFMNWKDGQQRQINIVDFFAGQGKDINGVYGSPLIIISTLMKYKSDIVSKKLRIRVILNEIDKTKYNLLIKEIAPFSDGPFELISCNKPFSECYNEHQNRFNNAANYIFLDQNGIKEITEGIFSKLISLKMTDILFFISSSYLYRFNALPDFKKYLDTRKMAFDIKNYHSCHRAVLEFYKGQIVPGKEYYLGPFSLKKGSNIYGLIFGSNHTYGIEKFLKICWELDPQRGEANYDIDSDKINPQAPSLFGEFNIPKKMQVFGRELEKYLLSKQSHLLSDIYKSGLTKGFQPKHTNAILRDLKSKNRVNFNGGLLNSKIHKMDNSITVTNSVWPNQK